MAATATYVHLRPIFSTTKMKVLHEENFKTKSDLQIQTAAARLQVYVRLPNGTTLTSANVQVRLKIIDNVHGTVSMGELMSLKTYFEDAASKEGFYIRNENTDDQPWYTEGFIDISPDGALALGASRYISMEIRSDVTIQEMTVHAVPAPVPAKTYLKFNPLTIQGSAKDVPLTGVATLAIRPADIDEVRIQYPEINSEFTAAELRGLSYLANDIVSVDVSSGTANYGSEDFVFVNVNGASRATIQPKGAGQFDIYLIELKTL